MSRRLTVTDPRRQGVTLGPGGVRIRPDLGEIPMTGFGAAADTIESATDATRTVGPKLRQHAVSRPDRPPSQVRTLPRDTQVPR